MLWAREGTRQLELDKKRRKMLVSGGHRSIHHPLCQPAQNPVYMQQRPPRCWLEVRVDQKEYYGLGQAVG